MIPAAREATAVSGTIRQIVFMRYVSSRTRKHNTAAITGLSVRQEHKSPIPRYAHPSRKKPRIDPYAARLFTAPYLDRITGYVQITAIGIANIVTRARYLPVTISHVLSGSVNNS